VGRLAGGIAHDFNNMLGVILGNADLAASTGALDDHTESLVAEIRTAAERSSRLVAQLLAFARRQSFAPEVLDVNASVGRMLGMLRRFIGEDVSLVWSPGADLERVRMDPAQLDQVLANLVLNARDAIDGTGRIAISTHPCDGRSMRPEVAWDSGVSLSVEDDGHGMDEKTRAQIFDPFFTTKEVGQGTGLGLATVYGIVTQNRGILDVRSAPGRGTTFTLHLPAAPASDESDDGRRTPDPEDVPTGNERVLFVEDEVSVGNVVKSMLERLGYKVSAASSPRAALRIAEAQREFDILVTDVVMPEMNGRELAERVCQAIPGIVVLFVSGFSAHVLSEDDTSRNSVSFLQKPFRMHQLAAAIRAALDGERLRSQDR
jgi:CheY-like chemotaxis protein